MKTNYFNLILSSILVSCFINLEQVEQALATQPHSLLDIADSLFTYESYNEAITEYKRFALFHPEYPDLAKVHYKMGLAFQYLGEWEESIFALLRSIELSQSQKLTNEGRISISVSGVASENYQLALLELRKVMQSNLNLNLLRRAHFFRTVTYVYLHNWLEARNSFQFFLADSFDSEQRPIVLKLDSLLGEGNNVRYKSPVKAKWLSTFLPGSGQLYSGNYRDAFNAFALNSINFGFTYHLITQESYIDAALFFLYFGFRYYAGNRYHAEKDTQRRNELEIDMYKAQLIKYLFEFSQKF
jgi:tetratricopeptide (TPR) repeat protein